MRERGLAEVAGAQRGLVHLSQLRGLGSTRGPMSIGCGPGRCTACCPPCSLSCTPSWSRWPRRPPRCRTRVGMRCSAMSLRRAVGGHRNPLLRAHHRDWPPRPKPTGTQRPSGFPVTSPARTLIDCASGPLPIDRLHNEARMLELVKDSDLHAAMSRCPGRKGTKALRLVLQEEKDTGSRARRPSGSSSAWSRTPSSSAPSSTRAWRGSRSTRTGRD